MHIKRHALSIGFLVYSLTLIACILSTNANAATYYISPTGSNSNAGASLSAPWQTFSFAIPKLRPGDTLILLDGTYTTANSGLPYMNCSSNAANGIASQPITFMALNERRAHLQGSGNNVLQLDNCSYWVIQGIYSSNVDMQVSGYEGSTFVSNGGDHLTFRRNLAYGPNAYFNSHGFAIYGTSNALLEENEVYYVGRHGIVIGTGGSPSNDGDIVRRNYLHSRDHDARNGGFTCPGSCDNNRGDEGISCYPCKNSIIENNIVEDFEAGFTIQAKTDAHDNTYLGNIALNGGGFGFTARSGITQNTADQMPTNMTLVNNLVYHGQIWAGFGCRTCKNTQMTNNSVIDNVPPNAYVGILWDASCGTSCGEGGDGFTSNFATNMLIVNANGAAFDISNLYQWSVDHLLSYNNAPSSLGLSDPHYTNVLTSNPNLGTCKVFIPNGSPAKGAGVGGADIGANILYRYQDGVLTNTPLWDPTTSRFPCGAQVAGINDIAGASCFDVHTRLNVNTNGCTLPTTPTTVALPAPTNLRLLVSQP